MFATKPISYHHCHILETYYLFNFNHFKYFKFTNAIYKILHGHAPPPSGDFIKLKTTFGRAAPSMFKLRCDL